MRASGASALTPRSSALSSRLAEPDPRSALSQRNYQLSPEQHHLVQHPQCMPARCPPTVAAAVAAPSSRLPPTRPLAPLLPSTSPRPASARQRTFSNTASTSSPARKLSHLDHLRSSFVFPHRSFSSSRAMASCTQLLQVRAELHCVSPSTAQADARLLAGHPRRQRDLRRRVRPGGPGPPQEARRRPEPEDLLARLLRLARLGRTVRPLSLESAPDTSEIADPRPLLLLLDRLFFALIASLLDLDSATGVAPGSIFVHVRRRIPDRPPFGTS